MTWPPLGVYFSALDSRFSRIWFRRILSMITCSCLRPLLYTSKTVESEKGKGTTFTVNLELHVSEQEIDQNFWKNHGITRILAVDDEEVICQNIAISSSSPRISALISLSSATRMCIPFRMLCSSFRSAGCSGS